MNSEKTFKVGIAGAGGIGSNIAVHLIRSGFTNIKIVDFDKIELSNLNRQFYFFDQIGQNKIRVLLENLTRINPSLNIEIEEKILDASNITETFNDCNIIVEGFDNAELKAMLINAFAASNKIVISACGVAGLDIENITVKKISDKIFIVGDFTSDIKDKKLYSPKIFIVASMMANIILKLIGFSDNIIQKNRSL